MSDKLVLGYWAIRGLAERIRHLLEYTGLPYEEVRYQESSEDQWFKVDKPKYLPKNAALTLPYLLDGEKVITESTAIIVYICHKANRLDLLGRNAEEQVLLATAYGVYKDFQPQLSRLAYQTPANVAWEEALSAFWGRTSDLLNKLENLLGEKEFICGGITWIDFIVADTVQVARLMSPAAIEKFANLLKLQERVWSLPELSPYFKSERWHERPVNGEEARWR